MTDAFAILNDQGRWGPTSGEGSQEGPQSLRGVLERMIGALGPGGLDSWDALIKRDCYLGAPPESQTTNSNFVDCFFQFTLFSPSGRKWEQ